MFGTAGVLKPATPEGAANEQKEELRPAGNSVLPYVPAIHCRRPTKNVLITRSSCRNAPQSAIWKPLAYDRVEKLACWARVAVEEQGALVVASSKLLTTSSEAEIVTNEAILVVALYLGSRYCSSTISKLGTPAEIRLPTSTPCSGSVLNGLFKKLLAPEGSCFGGNAAQKDRCKY